MMQFNLLKWCDNSISYLKENKFSFIDGIPQLSEECIYKDRPKALSTFTHRNDIPKNEKQHSLISYYVFEERLWPRLYKIDEDIKILKEYGGIVGFDLSPCIGMLRPRQKMSIMINALYCCYCGSKGIKILPNFRAGDFETIETANYFPDRFSFMVGNLGCVNNEFKTYGEYQLDIILQIKRPQTLYVYGSITKREVLQLIKKYNLEIIVFPDRRNRIRNNKKTYRYFNLKDKIYRCIYQDFTKRRVA